MKKEELRIEYPMSTQILLKFGGIVLMLVGIGLAYMAWKVEYLQIIPFLLGLLFLAFGFVCFSEGFGSIIINSEGIKQRNLIRAIKIPKNQVKGYAEITYKSSKRKKTTHLIISDKQRKRQIKFDKESHGHKYELILKHIKSDYKRVSAEDISKVHERQENLYRNIGKAGGIVIFFFGLFQLLFFDTIPQEKFQQLIGTVSAKPIIVETNLAHTTRGATYQFDEYPEYRFKVTGENFRMLHPNAKILNIGTNVKMKILKTEYQAKIEKAVTLDFAEKHINWGFINLYEISHNGDVLLNAKDINNSRSNPIPKTLMMLFGIGIFIYFGYFSKGYD